MHTLDEAWRIALDAVRPLPVEDVPLDRAAGRCLAAPVVADRDMPPADRSAMDGYAVRADDVRVVPAVLSVVDEIAAGASSSAVLRPGTCARIFTGANVPAGADTVVMQEHTQPGPGADAVTVERAVAAGANILKQGENARAGDGVVAAGAVLSAVHVGVCAGAGRTTLSVHGRPRVAILTTGAELRDASAAVRPHEIRDTNGPMLAAAFASHGFATDVRPRVADDIVAIAQAIRDALGACAVAVLTGGVSVGRFDCVPEAVRRAGGAVRFHHVDIKPGRPLLFATFGPDRCLWGLPGNPVSALAGLHELVLPQCRRLGGVPEAACRPCVRLPLAETVRAKGARFELRLAALAPGARGLAVQPVPNMGSADLVAASRADGMFALPAGVTALPAGTLVDFHPWSGRP